MNWVIARHLENISACLHLSVCVYVIKNGMGLSSLVEHPLMVKYVLIELFFVNNQCFISKVSVGTILSGILHIKDPLLLIGMISPCHYLSSS